MISNLEFYTCSYYQSKIKEDKVLFRHAISQKISSPYPFSLKLSKRGEKKKNMSFMKWAPTQWRREGNFQEGRYLAGIENVESKEEQESSGLQEGCRQEKIKRKLREYQICCLNMWRKRIILWWSIWWSMWKTKQIKDVKYY